MPLKILEEKFGKYGAWIENGFWIALFIFLFILMQKLMHPGWKIFGV